MVKKISSSAATPSKGLPSYSQARRAWLDAAWAQQAETHRVEVEGARIAYRGWGLEHVDRPGLVLVHGFRAHSRWWDHIAPHFTDRYRVIAPDFSGMGRSGRRPAYSRRQFAREILAVARHAGFDEITMIAHSFGGVSAVYACHLDPDYVRRAIIVDTYILRPERSEFEDTPPRRFYPSRAAGVARYRLSPSAGWADPAIVAYIAEHSLVETPQGWTWHFDPVARETIDREPGLVAEIETVRTPIDFIYGDRSEIVGEEALATMHRLPSCGPPIAIPLCHHHVLLEQPLALMTTLDALLSQPR